MDSHKNIFIFLRASVLQAKHFYIKLTKKVKEPERKTASE